MEHGWLIQPYDTVQGQDDGKIFGWVPRGVVTHWGPCRECWRHLDNALELSPMTCIMGWILVHLAHCRVRAVRASL